MSRLIASIVVVGVILNFQCPLLAQGKKGQQNKVIKQNTTAQDYAALARMSGVVGEIVSVNGQTIVFQVEYQIPEVSKTANKGNNRPNNNRPNNNRNLNRPNRNQNNRNNRNNNNRNQNNRNRNGNNQQAMRQMQQRQLQQLRQRQQQMMRQYAQALQRAQQQAAKSGGQITFKTYAKEFQLTLSSDVAIAKRFSEVQYDEKGNVKKLTDAEYKAQKHPKLPGLKSSLEEIMPGMSAYVYLGKLPKATAPKGKAKEKEDPLGDILGDLAAGDNENGPTNSGPIVRGIVLLTEPDISSIPDAQKKGKKKAK